MSKRNIVIEPDPILRKRSSPVEEVNNDLRKLLNDMLETMYEAPGIGLAAVQVGILKRLIVIDISMVKVIKIVIKHSNMLKIHQNGENGRSLIHYFSIS